MLAELRPAAVATLRLPLVMLALFPLLLYSSFIANFSLSFDGI